ncbi:MAG: hypothetical protein J6L96_00290 [Clostridia bacterium]|nr:hypothetical protein [Clostridia bacterium]
MAKKKKISVREIVVFAMLGALMFCSKVIMEALPNIHLLGMLTMVYTVVFRRRALIPIYIYVFMNGLYSGFNGWWVPYLYIWTLLWGVTMLLPRKMNPKVAYAVYPVVCAVHGLLFGTLYAPAQALMYGFSFEQTVAWIVSGLPFDVIHGVSNLFVGMLILPLSRLLHRLMKS